MNKFNILLILSFFFKVMIPAHNGGSKDIERMIKERIEADKKLQYHKKHLDEMNQKSLRPSTPDSEEYTQSLFQTIAMTHELIRQLNEQISHLDKQINETRFPPTPNNTPKKTLSPADSPNHPADSPNHPTDSPPNHFSRIRQRSTEFIARSPNKTTNDSTHLTPVAPPLPFAKTFHQQEDPKRKGFTQREQWPKNDNVLKKDSGQTFPEGK